MKKLFFLAAAVCAFALVSCEQEEIDNEEQKPAVEIKVNISADTIFTDGQVAVVIKLTEKSESDVTVKLAVSTDKVQDKDLIDAEALSFSKQSSTIKAGATSDTIIVSVDPTKAYNYEYAAIKIASAQGATIGDKSLLYIMLKKSKAITLMQNWSVRLQGTDIYDLSDDPQSPYPVMLTDVVADSIQYFTLDAWTESELQHYFDGSWEDLIINTEEEYQFYYAMYGSGVFFSITDQYIYVYYWGAGNYYIVMTEFDANANATGRYGVSLAQFPDDEEGGDGVAPRRAPYAQPTKSYIKHLVRIK